MAVLRFARPLLLFLLLLVVLPLVSLPLGFSHLANSAQAQQDPFKRSGRSTEQEKSSFTVFREKLQRMVVVPPWFLEWQHSVKAKVSETALKIKESPWSESWGLFSLGFLLSIVFGFLHIAGPGHGKIFTISYFMSRRATLREGLGLSVMINIVDSLSAGLVVFLTYRLLSLTPAGKNSVEVIISTFSYGIILLWGLWHFGQHLVGHLRGGHGGHGGHACGHTHAAHGAEAAAQSPGKSSAEGAEKPKRPAWYFALGIGLVPCPISTGLLIFGLLNQMLGLAIFLVVGVSLGGMIAMTMLSFAVIGGKKGILSLLVPHSGGAQNHDHSQKKGLQKLWSFAGEFVELLALGLMILVAGIFLLLSLPF